MDFNKWDRIYLTNAECVDLLDMVNSEDVQNNRDHPLVKFREYPLHRFVLTTPNREEKRIPSVTAFHYFFEMAGEHLDVRGFVEKKNGELFNAFSFTADLISLKLKKKDGPAAELINNIFTGNCEYWAWLMLTFMLINTYILSNPEKTTNVEVREVQRKLPEGVKSNRSQKKRGPNKVRLVRSYRLKRGWKSAVKRQIAQITCPAWGVRGHFRHYKNGQIVFIKPYVKGKKRDEYKGKVYELFPSREDSVKVSEVGV